MNLQNEYDLEISEQREAPAIRKSVRPLPVAAYA
jgi:plasmid maintenance system antidote protein VapI